LLLFPLFTLFSFQCYKEDPDVYYVKYIADGKSTIQQANPNGLKIFINDENAGVKEFIRSNRGENEFTIGPVRKGFISRVAILNICPPLDCYIRPFLQIQISQNDGPFIIKKELITTQYTNDAAIDFIID